MPESAPPPPPSAPLGAPGPASPKLGPWQWAAAAVVVLISIGLLVLQSGQGGQLRYDELKAQISSGNVADLTLSGTDVSGDFKKPVAVNGTTSSRFRSRIPDFTDPQFVSLLADQKVHVDVQAGGGGLLGLLGGLLPFLLLGGLWIFLMRRGSSTGGALDFGRSRARVRFPGNGPPSTTFADVAGVDEAKAELEEIVDFLRDPARFTRLGGRMPRGVLLLGAPGTGKTLLARAVAGEARVPFLSISASEFVEMFVGVGAARVRSLFEEAKKNSPAVIFVDELDAVGRQRGAGVGGGHDEREQTLNQLLVEMDGFDPDTGIVVMAASNRPDVLDPALLRRGRFDRRITVGRPDKRGRQAILAVHSRTVQLGTDVDLEALAASTTGLVGSDLASLVNEAALTAARNGHQRVMMSDFETAFDRILLGAERKLLLTEADRRVIAYHEAGHAVVGWFTPAADPVRKVTIVPRGETLGVTHSMPTDDRYNVSEEYLRACIAMALGGRAAEELVLGSITTGAQNDLEMATEMARRMVSSWGMSARMGLLSHDDSPESIFLGRELASAARYGPETATIIDEEAREILAEGLRSAQALLREHRSELGNLAQALLHDEVLDEGGILHILGPRPEGNRWARVV